MKNRFLVVFLAVVMLFTMTVNVASLAETADDIMLDQLTLGKDYTDLSASIKVVTHRTDIVDTVLAGYVEKFNEIYPNIKIEYEAIQDYIGIFPVRLTTGDWGDICIMNSGLVSGTDLPTYFAPLAKLDVLDAVYNGVNRDSSEGIVYGVPSTNNVTGIVYNKRVFEQAGIDKLPTTPDEFIDCLQKIKDNTDATPLSTCMSDTWPMVDYSLYMGATSTGDADFLYNKLPYMKNPFADRGDGTGPYAVMKIMYDAVNRGLVEDDVATSTFNDAVVAMNNGKLGVLLMQNWAVAQVQAAGPNPDDIGFMAFPISVDGTQYLNLVPDVSYAVNANSSEENKIASKLYIKWLVEESNFDYDQAGVPTVKTHEYPAILSEVEGYPVIPNNPEVNVGTFTSVNLESELGLMADAASVAEIVECAIDGSKSFDQIMGEWNSKWSAAQEALGIEAQ